MRRLFANRGVRLALWIVAGLLVLGGAVFGIRYLTPITAQKPAAGAGEENVAILPADAVLGGVSASGKIALGEIHYVALGVEGTIARIHVKVGDRVQAGDALLAVDTVELERAVRRAELTVQARVNQLEKLREESDVAQLAVAQADLAGALENLAKVRAGPTNSEIAAARSSLSAAQARYNDLVSGPTPERLTQLAADLHRKEIALAEAQREYDAVAWRNDVGRTSQASTLQQATIDYEASAAAYAESVLPATQAELQSAMSDIQNAQVKLDELLATPSPADIASAEAQVAQAQSNLTSLEAGADAADLRDAQINLDSALVDLQEAYAKLAQAEVSAPIDGVVLTLDAEIGRQGSRGAVVAALADVTRLELTIGVSEVDISQVAVGQQAAISIDALPGRTFAGTVTTVAPINDESATLVNYPVTITLDDDQLLAGVLPGMTAVAVLDAATDLSGAWLVPTSAVRREGGTAAVTRVRDGVSQSVSVMPGGTQGEWTVVRSPDLRAGDAVVGSLASSTQSSPRMRFPGGSMGSPPQSRP